MDKIPILIIAPFFAPQSHAAMFRVHKLVKYLPEYGYKPIVITTDINYNYNEDLKLLEELPSDVEIHRVRYIEPTMRGLRIFFGGKDRTFKTMKQNMKVSSSKENVVSIDNNKEKSFLRKIYSNIQHFLLSMPDAHWTWMWSATNKANKLIKQYDIGLFYTTANPNSVLQIGLNIKSKNNIIWISDYRDPIGYIDRYRTNNKVFEKYDRNLIKNAITKADHVTGLANSYKEIFNDLYDLKNDKFSFIPTGLDDSYLKKSNIESEKEKYILFSGEFLIEYGAYFFEVFSEVIKDENLKNLKILFIGRIEINRPMVLDIVKNYEKLIDNIEFIDHIPQNKLYILIKNSTACLLSAGFKSRWYCNYAKMVDYIALKKPVISVVPKKSEARDELDKSGLGIHLTGAKDKDILLLKQFFNKQISISPTNHCKKYLASSQVEEFSKIFDKLLKEYNE